MTKAQQRATRRKIRMTLEFATGFSGGSNTKCKVLFLSGDRIRIIAGKDADADFMWSWVAQSLGTQAGLELLANGTLYVHCQRCNMMREAKGFEDDMCELCYRPPRLNQSDEEKLMKQRARAKTNQAIKTGVLKRPERCEGCGTDETLEVHHPDYAKPLEIEWLCSACHGKRHWGPRRILQSYGEIFRNHIEAREGWI